MRKKRVAVPTPVTLPNGDIIRCRSKFEAGVVSQLANAGAPLEYEGERLCYDEPRVYIPDIVLRWEDGAPTYIEVKGYMDREDRRKLKSVMACNPGIDLRIVFQNAKTKISGRPTSMRYWRWAEQHGILWAEGAVPMQWLLP